jgi:hypothetical protein
MKQPSAASLKRVNADHLAGLGAERLAAKAYRSAGGQG